jgi:hypothetical protein
VSQKNEGLLDSLGNAWQGTKQAFGQAFSNDPKDQ